MCREPGRQSTPDKGHEEGGSAYANAGSSLRSPSLLLALFSVGIQLPLALLSTCIQLPFALWLALKLSKHVKGERAYLSIYFMPVLISTVVIGQLWLKIYNPDYGVLNVLLRAIGLEKWTQIWLGDKKYALGAAFVP